VIEIEYNGIYGIINSVVSQKSSYINQQNAFWGNLISNKW